MLEMERPKHTSRVPRIAYCQRVLFKLRASETDAKIPSISS